MKFEDLIAKVHSCGRPNPGRGPPPRDDAVLEAVAEAHKQGIADAILVGEWNRPSAKLRPTCRLT